MQVTGMRTSLQQAARWVHNTPRSLVVRVSAFVDNVEVKTTKAGKPKKAKADGAIKRAPSAYNLYFRAVLPELKAKAAPGTKVTDLTVTLSGMWKNLPEEEKTPFVSEAVQLKSAVAEKRKEAKIEAKKNARPATPYAQFVSQMYGEISRQNPGLKTVAVMGKIAEAWKDISADRKADMGEEYKTQVEIWKAKQELQQLQQQL